MRLNAVDWISGILLIIGGLNWGLIGLFQYDLVAAIFGPLSAVSRGIYIVVGIAALAEAVSFVSKLGYSATEEATQVRREESRL
ncbi:MAG: DUF378 domain-containing protein [Candidatus Peribacteraceae bacterium]|jgi:hypothetical protein